MKKIILGLIIGLIIALPIGAIALSQNQQAQQVQAISCSNDDIKDSCSAYVYKFNDGGNSCYVMEDNGDNQHDISCVRYAK